MGHRTLANALFFGTILCLFFNDKEIIQQLRKEMYVLL
jgi:hypothetical protein